MREVYVCLIVVDITRVKGWARVGLLGVPRLRSLIMSEHDQLSVEEFVTLVGVWLRLLEDELEQANGRG